MKKLWFFTICWLMISCNLEINPEVSVPDPSKIIYRGSSFEHQIVNCKIDPTFENTCTDWVMFRGENKVDYLIGRGDIAFQGNVVLVKDSIIIYNENTGEEALKFLPVHVDTQLEINSGEKWERGRFYDLE